MVNLTSHEAWGPNQPRNIWVKRARIYDLAFIIVFAVISFSIQDSFEYGSNLPIPGGQLYGNSSSGRNLMFSYPIYMNGHECWPDDLFVCLSAPDTHTSCCEDMKDSATVVYETISTLNAVLITGIVSICVLGVRILLWQNFVRYICHVDIDYRYWCKVLWDTVLGGIYAVVITVVVTDYIKLSVGAPRPIYYALKIFSSVHKHERHWYNGKVHALLTTYYTEPRR